MVMPLRELRAIYELLFRDGVMVAKKDKRPQTKHPEIPGISNLQVIRAMTSLKSRGYVKETYAWRHFYWYLSNEGIVYLRDYLRLPAEIVPASLQRVKRPAATLAISRRAAQVQSVEGPTSYVPKPGGRPGFESREALAERQGYRHKMANGEEGSNDRTPRFRGRPAAAEPVRPRASWETKDQQQQHLYTKGRGFSNGDAIIGEDQVRKTSVSSQQKADVSSISMVQAKKKDQTPTSPPVTLSGTVISKASVEMTTTAERSITRTSKAISPQDKPKPVAEKTTNKPLLTADPIKEEKRSTIEVAQKLDEFPTESLPVNALPRKDTEITVELPKSVVEAVSTTVVSSSQTSTAMETKSKVEIIEKSVKEAEKPLMVAKVPTPSDHHAELLKNDVTENVSEENVEGETSSKSKKKKKKSSREKAMPIKASESPDIKMTAEKVSKVQASLNETQKTSETPTLPPTVNLEGPSNDENKLEAKMSIDVKLNQEVPKPIVDQTVSKAVVHPSAVPPVEIPVTAQVKDKVEETSLSEIPQGPLCSKDGVTNTELTAITHQETSKSEIEIVTRVTRVKTVTVHKTVTIEQTLESTKPVEEATAVLSESQKVIDEREVKASDAVSNAVEETSKGKKRGKAKKQTQARVSVTLNTEPISPPATEPLSPIDVLSSPQATTPSAIASEQTDGSSTTTPERMCSEEIRQATAVLTEAPADKGEEEPAQLSAKKIKREVPKPKTSSSVREAPAAREIASAEPAVAAEATGAKAQASPCVEQGKPPGVEQLQSAAQAGKHSTEEKRLSVLQASVQEDQQDWQEDTPSVTATPEATQPHLVDSCHSLSQETDEANMRRKIVVVEEIIEVKQIASPHAGAESPPAPVKPAGEEEEEEELDLDVLEELAIERALLNAAPPATAYGASPEEDWDHALEDPEEKTWPNFIEGLSL
ncbi:Plectin [Merluccius polli]|uniref:Plectin n=1 Tax=Merluccius polli TaxID=89951 RepID=A0AA47M5U9_MERPO|nr:Plectin [Merluccius polli]